MNHIRAYCRLHIFSKCIQSLLGKAAQHHFDLRTMYSLYVCVLSVVVRYSLYCLFYIFIVIFSNPFTTSRNLNV